MKNYKNKKQKKIVLSGYFGFDNFGDEAILGVLSSKLKSLDCDITALSRNPAKTSELYGIKSILSFCPAKVIFRILKSDMLFSGGGSLLQDVTSSKSLIYYLIIINIALFFRKPVVIFAQGIGPINGKFDRFLTKHTLKRCKLVTVRDKKSFELMNSWNINANLLCDPLFSLNLSSPEPSNKVGVQLRSFKTLTDKMLLKLAEHVSNTFSDKEIELFSFQDKLDLDVCKKFEKMLKSFNNDINTTVQFKKTSNEILDKIADLDYMIGMRFHACLIALKYGIKTLAINYDEKVEKLAQEAEIPYISMSGKENYREKFEKLKNLDREKLVKFSNEKKFDWSLFEKIILN